MTRYGQIIDGIVFWITDAEGHAAFLRPAFDGAKQTVAEAHGLVFVPITEPEVQEGWTYDGKVFAAAIPLATPAPSPPPDTQTLTVTAEQWKVLSAAATILAGLKPS